MVAELYFSRKDFFRPSLSFQQPTQSRTGVLLGQLDELLPRIDTPTSPTKDLLAALTTVVRPPIVDLHDLALDF